ncbi:OmpA family protein [Cystobacter fuscus]
MSRLAPLLLVLLLSRAASAQDARFDVQAFRPSGAPQDLVGVGQSRPLSHLSISGGAYLNFMLDPLVLVAAGTNSKSVSLVGNRLQLDVMASVGLYNWVEVGVDMPLVLFQGSDNLEAIGTEGFIQSFTPADLRLTAKAAIPGLRRSAEGNGFGGALTLGMSLPTGLQDAFASDGSVTWSPGLVTDYRFESGVLLAFNAGFWLRPARQFANTLWGNSLTFGLGAEVPILRANGITAMGMLTGSTPLEKLLNQPQALPTELLFGLRWYTGLGLTFTVGGGGGCGCSPTSPTLRLFTSLIWVPAKTREWEAIQRFKEPPEPPLPPPPPWIPTATPSSARATAAPTPPAPWRTAAAPTPTAMATPSWTGSTPAPCSPRARAAATAARSRASRATRSSSSTRSTSPPTRTSSSPSPSPSSRRWPRSCSRTRKSSACSSRPTPTPAPTTPTTSTCRAAAP